MGKKTYNTDGKREWFNKTPYGDSRKLRKQLLEALNEVAEKYDATPISLRERSDYPSDFRDREWSWRQRFFRKYLDKAEATHNNWPERIWLDNLIRQCACMVWDLTHNTITIEYQNGGTWPDAENLPRSGAGQNPLPKISPTKRKKNFA